MISLSSITLLFIILIIKEFDINRLIKGHSCARYLLNERKKHFTIKMHYVTKNISKNTRLPVCRILKCNYRTAKLFIIEFRTNVAMNVTIKKIKDQILLPSVINMCMI